MAIKHPKIDQRTFKDIIQQILGDPETGLKGLRDFYTPKWTSRDSNDPGIVLTKLFAKLMEIVLERLNRIPEKNFVAFLDLLGIDRLPGTSARTPVKFILPAGNTSGGFVRAGTQVVTGPTESGNVHVFETEKGVYITPVTLEKVFSILPNKDLLGEQSFLIETAAKKDISVVQGEENIEHSLYIGDDTLLGFSEEVDVTFNITMNKSFPSEIDWEVQWQRCVLDEKGDEQWPPINFTSTRISKFLNSGQITLPNFPGTALTVKGKPEEGGGEAHWIRAILKTSLTPELIKKFVNVSSNGLSLPQITGIEMAVSINREVPIDAAFYNSIPLDVSKDFLPFGESPRLADTFYLASTEAFSKPGAEITLTIKHSLDITVTPINIQLEWEVWNGQEWESVNKNIDDQSDNFSKDEQSITFTLPDNLQQKEENGINAHWIRVRITKGNYGEAAQYVLGSPPDTYIFVPPSFHPPILSSITLSYEVNTELKTPEKCLACNNFQYSNHLTALTKNENFPYVQVQDKESALYLGFKEDFGDKAISLFFHIIEKDTDNDLSGTPSTNGTAISVTPPQVIWEYSTPNGTWNRLELGEDSTNHLTTSGTISFIGPDDFSEMEQFSEQLFWLRARIQSGTIPENYLLKGIYVNTVWTAHLTTIRDEILGSGNGEKEQKLAFSQTPVLRREEIYVREPEIPSEETRQTLEAMEKGILTGDEKRKLIQRTTNPITAEEEIWVRWHRVENFFGSDAQSRHYILDRINGAVTFGDGQKGMIPPIGRDNIKAFLYQSGGGLKASEEVKPGVVKELRSSLPFVDEVTNVVSASGGSDPESVEDVLERGPQTIKNRKRAVTNEDFVWLAKQASTLVHQVKCLPTTNTQLDFEPGSLTLLIVPNSEESKPRLSQELIRDVKKYLLERCLPILKPNIYIIPPKYEDVYVKAEVVAAIPEEASVLEGRIVSRLNTFLHPVKGGPKWQGWEFGRNVYISEIYQLIEDTEGVDVVLSVELNHDPSLNEIEIGDNELPVSETHEIIMKTGESEG